MAGWVVVQAAQILAGSDVVAEAPTAVVAGLGTRVEA
jgi:hypothetical protein